MSALWVGLAGSIVYLDTTAVGQFMISQPLIACPLWGLLVGRPEIGLFFGVTFQLLWLGSLPIGAAKYPEGSVGALVATALAAGIPPAESGEPAWVVLAVAAFMGIVTAQIGSEITPLVRRALDRYEPKVVSAAAAGKSGLFRLLFSGAIAIHAAVGFLFAAGMYIAGKWLFTLYTGKFNAAGVSDAVIESTDQLLSGVWPALLGAGAAVIVRQFVTRKRLAWFGTSTVVFLVAGWLWYQ